LPFRIIEVCFAGVGLHVERFVIARHTAGQRLHFNDPGFGNSPDRAEHGRTSVVIRLTVAHGTNDGGIKRLETADGTIDLAKLQRTGERNTV